MLIDKFTVRSFKSIVNEEIELGQVNVFIGANGSGKSNLLEALGVLSAAVSGRVDDESLMRRGVRPGVPRLYKNAFANLRTPPHISFEAQAGKAKYAVSLNNPLDKPQLAWQFKTEDLRMGEQRVASRGPRSNQLGAYLLSPSDITEPSLDPLLSETINKLKELLESPETRQLIDFFSQVRLHNPEDISSSAYLESVRVLENSVGAYEAEFKEKNKEQGIAALSLVRLGANHAIAQLMNHLRDYAIYTPNTPSLRGLIADPQTREPVGLAGGRLADAVKELQTLANKDEEFEKWLDEVIDIIDWTSGFDTSATAQNILSASAPRPKTLLRFKDRFMRKGHNELTAYDASEGALYVLFNAVLALSPHSPSCFAIDNFDQALNPRLAKALIQLFCRMVLENPQPRQALLTLHNPAVLDGLNLRDERIRLFAVDRNSEGHTKFNRVVITDALMELHQEKDWPLSRMWMMGLLGGVPNV
jgi:predicted ATPase